MWLKITLVGLIAVAVALGGCGGDGDSSDTDGSGSSAQATNAASDATNAGSTSASDGDGASAQTDSQPLTKAQLIKQGDKICEQASAKIVEEWQLEKENYGRGFGAQPSQKQNEEGLVDIVVPVIQEQAEEFADLDASPAEEDEIEAIAEALEEGARKTEAKPSLAEARGPKNPLDKASKLSRQFGFKVCGS